MDLINKIRPLLETETREDVRILELGCNEGANLHALHEILPEAEYVGYDICDEAIFDGSKKYPELALMQVNVDKLRAWSFTEKPFDHFDYILMPDILEHLSDPIGLLKWVYDNLRPGGITVSCIPNLMHVSVMQDILKYGIFVYTDVGLLDRDHKHFFTKGTIISAFNKAGFDIMNISSKKVRISSSLDAFAERLSELSDGFLSKEEYTTFEYLVTTEPKEVDENE